MPKFQLETDRLIIRSFEEEDFPEFSLMCADPAVMEFFPSTLNEEESKKLYDRICTHYETYGYSLYSVVRKDTGEWIGFTGLLNVPFECHFAPAVEIGWRLKSSCWGKGFATEAAEKVLDYAFSELQLDEVVSFTATINLRSIKVMERIGLTKDEDFDHPRLDKSDRLCKHVLYKAKNSYKASPSE